MFRLWFSGVSGVRALKILSDILPFSAALSAKHCLVTSAMPALRHGFVRVAFNFPKKM